MKTRSPVSYGLSDDEILSTLMDKQDKINHSLRHKQEDDSIESWTSRGFEDETCCDTQSVKTRKGARYVDSEYAQTDKKQYNKRKEEQDLVKRLQSHTDVTHGARQESTLLVDSEEGSLDFCARDVPIVIFVEDSECSCGLLGSRKRRVEVFVYKIRSSAILEPHINWTREPL